MYPGRDYLGGDTARWRQERIDFPGRLSLSGLTSDSLGAHTPGGRRCPCGHEGERKGGAHAGGAAPRAPLVRRGSDARQDAGGQGGVGEQLSGVRVGELTRGLLKADIHHAGRGLKFLNSCRPNAAFGGVDDAFKGEIIRVRF